MTSPEREEEEECFLLDRNASLTRELARLAKKMVCAGSGFGVDDDAPRADRSQRQDRLEASEEEEANSVRKRKAQSLNASFLSKFSSFLLVISSSIGSWMCENIGAGGGFGQNLPVLHPQKSSLESQ